MADSSVQSGHVNSATWKNIFWVYYLSFVNKNVIDMISFSVNKEEKGEHSV